ncbi:MAG: 30S ribosomal protein S6 [Acidobacteria bacterium]|nr:30S ribosomal protein S6 [Acidobacteriota bacterium]
MSAQRQYELVYIVPAETTEQALAELHTLVEGIVGRFSGTIEKTEAWGRRKLAYEIGPHKEGHYVLELINGPGEMVRELDRRLKVNELVFRHLIVRVDEEMAIYERRKAERAAGVAARRLARGLSAEPAVEAPVEAGAVAVEADAAGPAEGEE